jgi:O-antigen ligase
MAPGVGVANVCLALCLASAIAWRLQARRAGEPFLGPFARTTPLHGPLGAFVLLSILSCFFSTLPSRSLIQIKGFGTFFLVAFAAALLDDDDDVALLVDAWRLTTLYLVLRGFVEWLSGADNLGDRVAGGLSVYMTYAGLLLVFVPLLAGRGATRGRSFGPRAADLALAAAGSLAMVLSLTRSAYLGLGVAAVALVLAARPRLALAVPVVLVAFFLTMPEAVRDRFVSSFDPTDVTMRDRLVMWKAGAEMVKDHPLFGVGPGRVKALYPVYRQAGFVDPHPGHLHDNLVMIAAETGFLSLLAYLAFLAGFFRGAIRNLRTPSSEGRQGVTRGALAALAAVTVAGLFEYNFGDVEVLMATLVVAALPFVGSARPAGAPRAV